MRARDVAHLPGDRGLPLIGNTATWLRDPHAFSSAMADAHGAVFRSRLGADWNVTLLGPDANEFVLRNRDQVFSNQHGWGNFIGKLFANGLMLQDFDEHRLDRRALAGAFTPMSIAHAVDAIHRAMSAEIPTWAGSVTLLPLIKEFTLRMAAESFVGLAWGREAAELNRNFVAMVKAGIAINRIPLPGTSIKAGLDARRELVEYFRDECHRRRAVGPVGNDLFTQFSHATHDDGTRLDVDKVVDHIIFLLMAAHDTFTSAALSVVHVLATHLDWQDRLRAEIGSVIGPGPFDHDHRVTYDVLALLKETDWAFKEAIRLRPPVPAMPRRALRDFSYLGHHIPAGVRVGIDVHYTHHDPAHWDDPDRFDPTRFSPDRSVGRHDFAYLPFGGGVHLCLGARFATMQMRLFMVHLLTNFSLSVEPGYQPTWLAYPIQKPKDGLRVTLTPLPNRRPPRRR